MHKRKPSPPEENPIALIPQLLTIAQVASLLQVGQTTVYALIKQEGLPYVMVCSVKRIPAGSLAWWIKQRETNSYEMTETPEKDILSPVKQQRRKPRRG